MLKQSRKTAIRTRNAYKINNIHEIQILKQFSQQEITIQILL